jgi:3-methyladenine DNA glycosylase Tag
MQSYKSIYDRAAKRHGGPAALDKRLAEAKPKSAAALAKVPDDRWLSGMTKAVFCAGFSWKVIDAKWDGFEEAFVGFDPRKVAMMTGEDLDRLVSDTRIVRNGQKISATLENARLVLELADEYGSVGKAFGKWPSTDYVGLLELLKKRGNRLGGATAQYFLRFEGVDSFILSKDVSAALIKAGAVESVTASKKSMQAIQAAFNQWQEESGQPLTKISRTLALSIDG